MGWAEIASSCLLEGIQGLPFTDCVVFVEQEEFPCHRIVLSAYSDYFRAMFTSGMQEDINCQVKFNCFSHQTFASILAALYNGLDVLDESNAVDIWRVAHMLQITSLQKHAQKFLIDHLSAETCISVWREIKHFDEINSTVFGFIATKFQAIRLTEEFLFLTVEELVELISRDDLNVRNESQVVSGILRWTKHEKTRNCHLYKLLSLARLRCLSPNFTSACLLTESIVKEDKEVMALLEQDLLQTISPDRRYDDCPPSAVHRKNSSYTNVLVVLGLTDYTVYTYAYQLKSGRCFSIPDFPGVSDEGITACTYGEDIYVILSHAGGAFSGNMLYKFDVCKSIWLALEPMKINRFKHVQVAVGKSLYALGGECLYEDFIDNVECYRIEDDRWSVVGKLHTAVHSPGVAVSGKNILILGGKMVGGVSDKVQRFDTKSNRSSEVGTLPRPMLHPKTVYKSGKIFIITDEGQVYELLEEKSSVRFIPIGPRLWDGQISIFSAALYDDTLICACGDSGSQINLDVEVPGLCRRVKHLEFINPKECHVSLFTAIDKKYT